MTSLSAFEFGSSKTWRLERQLSEVLIACDRPPKGGAFVELAERLEALLLHVRERRILARVDQADRHRRIAAVGPPLRERFGQRGKAETARAVRWKNDRPRMLAGTGPRQTDDRGVGVDRRGVGSFARRNAEGDERS